MHRLIVSSKQQPFCFSCAGSFEIEINGQLIFSKMETSGFPYEDDVSKFLATGQVSQMLMFFPYVCLHLSYISSTRL